MVQEPPHSAPGMSRSTYSCPVCQMEIRHERGCPYEGLSMVKAWKQYWLDQRKACFSGEDVVASHTPPSPSADTDSTAPDVTDEVET